MPDTKTPVAFISSLNDNRPFVSFTMAVGERGKLTFLGTETRKCNATDRAIVPMSRPIAKGTGDVMTQTNNLEWWMILKISLREKAGDPKTLVKQKLRLHSLYFPQNTLMLTESRLHSLYFPQNTLMLTESRPHSLYFPQNTLMFTESCGEFSDLHSIFRFRCLRYSVRRQLRERGRKIGIDIRPVYTSRKIRHEIKPEENKLPIIKQQPALFTTTRVWFVLCKPCQVYVPTPISD